LGATIAGAVYIYSDKNRAALVGMEVLTLFVLIGAIMLIVWGSVGDPNSQAARP
jgi:hypothetical protein